MSTTDAAIQKKVHDNGTKTVRFGIKIVKGLEDSDVFMKGITETLKNDIKKVVLCL